MAQLNPVPAKFWLGRTFTVCALLVACGRAAAAQGVVVQGSAERAAASRPLAAYSASAQTLRDSLVSMARAQVGRRYRTGGQSPERGFDCSGLVRYVMSAIRVSLPRTARQQAVTGLAIARDTRSLRPGDLLTFGRSEHGASHVGIYIGNGRYVHASPRAGKVIESEISRTASPLVRAWRGVRRLVSTADSTRIGDG